MREAELAEFLVGPLFKCLTDLATWLAYPTKKWRQSAAARVLAGSPATENSIAVCDDDGFREVLNPSYALPLMKEFSARRADTRGANRQKSMHRRCRDCGGQNLRAEAVSAFIRQFDRRDGHGY
jgi:hypothetical protein